MACIHCALVQGYLPVLVIPALLGRHLAIRLLLNNYWTGTCLGGYCTGELFGLVSMWYGRTWEAHVTSKHIFNWYSFRRYSFVNGTVSSPEWQVCCCSQQQLSNLALEDSSFVLTYCLFTAGSSTSTISACTDLVYGLSGPLTYTWHDPKFGISFPPYAVNFSSGL